jgi:flagellar protein FlaG
MELSQINGPASSTLAKSGTPSPASTIPSPVATTGATQTVTANPVQPAASVEEIRNAVSEVQKAYKPLAQDLEFSIDKETGKTVVKLLDSQTNTVLRQIPSEEILAIARSLDRMQGLLVNQKE